MTASRSTSAIPIKTGNIFKRGFDLIIAVLLMIVTSPFWLVAIIGIKLTSPGPVFYIALRVGQGGGTFPMAKFRSMHVSDEAGSAITAPSDSRIFPFGAFMRASKIDEMPQLLNILAGHLSFVGPRPEDPGIVERHYDAEMREALAYVPGLTSVGAIHYMQHFADNVSAADTEQSYAENILRHKLQLEIEYARQATLLSDIGVMLKTGVLVIGGYLGRLMSLNRHE